MREAARAAVLQRHALVSQRLQCQSAPSVGGRPVDFSREMGGNACEADEPCGRFRRNGYIAGDVSALWAH